MPRAAAASRAQRLHRHPSGRADHPQLGALDLAEGLEQHVHALVGAHHAEAEDHRPLHGRELRRQRPLVGLAGQVVERAVGDHADAVRVGALALDQLAARRARVCTTTASIALRQPRVTPAGRRSPRRSTLCMVNTRAARGGGSSSASSASSGSHW